MITRQGPPLDALSDAQRFELLVTSVKDYAIYMLDTAGFIVSWNAGAERFKGYTASEVIGRHFSMFYTEEEKQSGVPQRALDTSAEHGAFEAEGWRLRKDGSRFWASVVIDPIRDPTGVLIGFAKVTRDISERKAAQEALRHSEQQFRLLVQGVTDYALYMLSPAGEVVSWNAGAERIKGYQAGEIIGKHFSRFYTEEDRASGTPARTLAIAAKDGRAELEGWRLRKDGSRFWAHVIVDAIRDQQGTLIGFAKITRDVTERRKAAAALDQANQALAHAQKMEAIGQLTGGVAHDFNNLLAVLANGLQVLTAQSRTHLDAKMIQTMQRAVDRGASLTQQLLTFARQQPLKAERLHLNGLIREFEPMLQRVGTASIKCEVRPAFQNLTVLLDVPQFEAALLNLVANSRDAMPDGGEIVISIERVELPEGAVGTLPAGAYARVSVTDTGTGMPKQVAMRALDPFFTTKEPGRGTGLGLSQVYGFVTQSGGDLVIRSVEGEGTTIELYFPLVEQDANSADEYAARLSVETVLLVDDEPDLLAAASELFQSIGYEVVVAGNASDAVEILKANPSIDILFSDIVMGQGMSGIELARLVSHDYPAVKIVLSSGYPLAALRRDHGELGEFTFIHKPYRLADLAKALRA
ncbi:PAS domain S-box protein [Paraburkholderia sp. IW21]|uniref:hybrid sensor histidine kinase/response regulator n=1 Tax=Paraburkholderia sp. IW21 TaxID=3242488 RepID=UPI0035227159